MVRESRDPRLMSGRERQTGGIETRVEYSGCITSKPDPVAEPFGFAKLGRIKCLASSPIGDVELIHYSNHERTMTLCGKQVTEKRPHMGSVMWGAAGYEWCDQCEQKILSE